ncbi:MAG: hypothetical protein ACOX7E_07855 [Paludibacter sp.]|jgi:hypothetical protein
MEKIEEIIKKSFRELKRIACEKGTVNQNQKSKLIFPEKRDNTVRISEQEIRLLMIRELEAMTKKDSYFYSIETPTRKCYKDFSTDDPEIAESKDDGQSGNIDLTLYNKELKREHLIEF